MIIMMTIVALLLSLMLRFLTDYSESDRPVAPRHDGPVAASYTITVYP